MATSKPSLITSTRRLLTCICTRTCGYLARKSGSSAGICCCASPTGTLTRTTPRGSALRRSTTSRSEEHTSELKSLMRNSYAVFCLKKQNTNKKLKQQYSQHPKYLTSNLIH